MRQLIDLDQHIALIDKINRSINRSVRYRTDIHLYNKSEFWTLTMNAGDCEDYALTKRAALIDSGIPWHLAFPGTGKLVSGELHAVLLLDTTLGLQTLDNLTNDILPWNNCSIVEWYGYADPFSETPLWKRLVPKPSENR